MGTKERLSLSDGDGRRDQHIGEETKGKTKTIPVILGLDISTTCTGVCVLNAQTGALIKLYAIKFNQKGIDDFWDKVSHLKKSLLDELDSDWDIRSVAVEEAAKRFSPGFSSADTIITLSKFNAIACHLMFEKFNIKPTYINVRSARSKLGIKIDQKDKTKNTKQKVFEIVFNMNPDFPWVYRTLHGEQSLVKINEDLGDSWVIAAATRKMFPNLTK